MLDEKLRGFGFGMYDGCIGFLFKHLQICSFSCAFGKNIGGKKRYWDLLAVIRDLRRNAIKNNILDQISRFGINIMCKNFRQELRRRCYL